MTSGVKVLFSVLVLSFITMQSVMSNTKVEGPEFVKSSAGIVDITTWTAEVFDPLLRCIRANNTKIIPKINITVAVVAFLMAEFEFSVNNAKIANMKRTRLVAIKI